MCVQSDGVNRNDEAGTVKTMTEHDEREIDAAMTNSRQTLIFPF